MERSMSLNPKGDVKPTDWSNQDNYTDQQIENMTKAMVNHGGSGLGGKTVYAGKGADRESSDNILDDQGLSNSLKKTYNEGLQGFYQDFRGQNRVGQGVQGHTSPFDTALDRFSPNVAQHINF
tara:strand:- start:861 stop:1229 length:369 start_codon:yes stop_codon:yes gene_type:complete